jgi:hypothetical protein
MNLRGLGGMIGVAMCLLAAGCVRPETDRAATAGTQGLRAMSASPANVPRRAREQPPTVLRAGPEIEWIARLGGVSDQVSEEVARAIDFDRQGAVFVVGSIGPGSVLAASTLSGTPALDSGGGTDAFVAVFDAGGGLRWAQRVGGAGEDYAFDVVADGRDGAWVCGTFTGTAWFGAQRLIAQGEGANGFAFHVTASGTIDGALHVGPSSGVIPGECAVDAQGRLYVSGGYSGEAVIGGLPLTAPAAGQTAGFVAAYAADGTLRWVRSVRASASAAWRGLAIAGDGSGDVLGIGQFRGTLTIGAQALQSSSNDAPASWVARFAADGTPRWALSPGGESYGRGIRADGAAIAIAGSFRGALDWPGGSRLVAAGGQDLYVARLDANGAPLWTRGVGGAADEEGAEIALDGGGNVYLGASFAGDIAIGGVALRSAGARDLLIARLDRDGVPVEGRAIGGSGDDVAYALEVSSGGWIGHAGFARGTVGDGVRTLATTGTHDALFGVLASAASPSIPQAVVSSAVTIPQRGGGSLAARVFAPAVARTRVPALSLLPGGGAPIDSVFWAAEGLAARGYVVIVTQPSSGGSLSAYHTAAMSGIDYLLSTANPYAAATDGERIGVAGWSLGARALSRTQQEDIRVDALVAWDNLAVQESGDPGSPNCAGSVPASRRTPRVPAMGQASDYCGPPGETVEDKKYAFAWWRSNAQPAMQIVLAGADHFVWSSTSAGSQRQADALYYTLAWFDRWLKNDPTARGRLLARSINGRSLETVLSQRFRSAAGFDGVDCGDLRTGCP